MASEKTYKDRTVGFEVFGCLEILMGLVVALLGLLILMVPKNLTAPSPSSMVGDAIFYFLIAGVFIWLGVGSILIRRWARALWLMLAWVWLLMGVLSCVFLVFFMPKMMESLSPTLEDNPGTASFVMWFTMILVAVLYILIPGVLVFFYGGKNAKATCEAKDRKIRWTDKCPLTVLSLSLVDGVVALFIPIWAPFYHFVTPFFGSLLSGWMGASVLLAWVLAFAYTAWGLYRLQIQAWWVSLGLYTLGTLSTVFTFSRLNLLDMYREIGMPDQQIETIQKTGVLNLLNPNIMAIGMAVSGALMVGYLLWIKKYFSNRSRKK